MKYGRYGNLFKFPQSLLFLFLSNFQFDICYKEINMLKQICERKTQQNDAQLKNEYFEDMWMKNIQAITVNYRVFL